MLIPRSSGPLRSDGIALVIVMLVIVALGILAGGFSYSMLVETRLARNANLEPDLEWLGRSGVELARYVLGHTLSIPGESGLASLNQKWAGGPGMTNDVLSEINLTDVHLGGGSFSVKIVDCERKVNINIASEELLQRAFTFMGVDAGVQSSLVDAILDWKDVDENPRLNGAESEEYLRGNPPYYSKNGPLDDIAELLMIRGVTPELFWGQGGAPQNLRSLQETVSSRSMSLGTTYSGVGLIELFTTFGTPQININTATSSVLQLLPGVDANIAGAILQRRAGYDGMEGTEDDQPFRSVLELAGIAGLGPQYVALIQRFCGVMSATFEVTVEAQMPPYTRRFKALVRRANARDVSILHFGWE